MPVPLYLFALALASPAPPPTDTTFAAAALGGYADPACATPRWEPLGTFGGRAAAHAAIGDRVGRVVAEVLEPEPGTPYAAVAASETTYVNAAPPASRAVAVAAEAADCTGVSVRTWGRSYDVDGARGAVRLVDAAGAVVVATLPTSGELPAGPSLPSGLYYVVVEDAAGRLCPTAVPLVQ